MTDVETPPRKRRPMSKADKAKRKQEAQRRGAEIRAITAERLERERTPLRLWMRAYRVRRFGIRVRPTFATLGPVTMAAIDAARGNLREAARALGIERSAMMHRIAECTVPTADGTETLRAWLDRTWPQRGGHRAVDVTGVTVEGTGLERVRVYALACGHAKRVAAVGVVRARVVCKVCKEAKEKSE